MYEWQTLLNAGKRFVGADHLLKAATLHAENDYGFITINDLWVSLKPDPQRNVLLYAAAHDIEPKSDVERQYVIAELRKFPDKTLRALLPITPHGYSILLSALGWEQALSLVTLIYRVADHTYSGIGADIPNAPDPQSGVLDVAAVGDALALVDKTLIVEIFDLFRKSGVAKNTLFLFEAVAGWNRQKIEKSIKKAQQIAIKGYGLLPVEHSEEVLERYLTLRSIGKLANKFGAQRRGTHAAAVQTALINLAQVAGYADVSRFEWDMEARITSDIAPDGREWIVDDYHIILGVEGVDVSLTVYRHGRMLKSIPQNVRGTDAYKEAREAVNQVRSQTNRLKNGLLEGLIASGDSLSVDELSRLMQLPTARSMFSKLLLRNQDGVIGLFHPDRMTLTDVAGAIHPAGSNLKVVHPYDLYLTDTLAAWQRDIVHRRIVQPIKQVFRELYLLTPAEQTTNTYSNRFAGQVVDGSIAAKLLATRGWRFDYGATPLPYKDFPHLQLRAIFSFPDVFHYFGENRIITADRILFQRYPLYKGFYATVDSDGIPLEEVPPLVFSEVMRDADLVVSVGQRDGEAKLSAEAYQRRGDVVRSLLDDLGLAGVEVDGHFAYVQGKLAWYRVHLGSAVIHIEPGNYLCIVPSHWGQRHERLFLPFADEADNKISEVISKILFLLADDRITDHSILRQIHRSL